MILINTTWCILKKWSFFSVKKLMRPDDDDIYKEILQYGLKTEFGFVIITKNEDTNGFTDKMMKVRVEQWESGRRRGSCGSFIGWPCI